MSEEKILLAGYSKVDITPDYPTGLGGYSNAESRQHTGIAENAERKYDQRRLLQRTGDVFG